jgi:hypothetical protein
MKSARFYDIQRRPSSKRTEQQSSASASDYRPFVSALRPSSFNPPIDTQPKRRRITAAASQAVKKVAFSVDLVARVSHFRDGRWCVRSDKIQNRYGPESNGNPLPNISEMFGKNTEWMRALLHNSNNNNRPSGNKSITIKTQLLSAVFGGDGLAPEMRVRGISKWPVDMSRHSSSGLLLSTTVISEMLSVSSKNMADTFFALPPSLAAFERAGGRQTATLRRGQIYQVCNEPNDETSREIL